MTDKRPLLGAEKQYHYKVVIVGDSFTGKSSLLSRLSDKEFERAYAPTIGVDYKVHQLRNVQGKTVRLSLWDNAGDRKFNSIVTNYFRGAEGVLLVYDVTNPASFANLKTWLAEIDNKIVPGSATVCVVGNKIDAPRRAVSRDDARSWAFERGFQYMECSALNGTNVEECFVSVATTLLNHALEREEAEEEEKLRRAAAQKKSTTFAAFFQRQREHAGEEAVGAVDGSTGRCGLSSYFCFLPRWH